MNEKDKIILYPSNWLYNAGVVGFLRVLETCGENLENFLKDDGSVEITQETIRKYASLTEKLDNGLDVNKFTYYYLCLNYDVLVEEKKENGDSEKIKKVWGKLFNAYYRGFFNADTRYLYESPKGKKESKDPLIKQFSNFISNMLSQKATNRKCSFCLSSNFNFSYKNNFTSEHNKILGASLNKVPNSFWNLNNVTSLNICDFCNYILIHHHLALTKLSDGSEIFINAPSFKIMWYLNKHAKEIYEKKKVKEVKEILGISLIELASKLYIQLGRWEKMNIEVISKYTVKKARKLTEDRVDFFSLPAEIVNLLTNMEISSLLKQIGEYKIFKMVLDGKFKEILNFAEKIFRINIKPKDERTENEEEFLNQNINFNKNKNNLNEFCQKLFNLYALIEEQIKKEAI